MVQAKDDRSLQVTDLLKALYAILHRTKQLQHADEAQRAAMVVLWQIAAYEPIRPSDLAGNLLLDQSTVSRQVRNLIDAGYLVRTEDPSDRRAFLISTTPQGLVVLEEALTRRAAPISQVLARWPAEDRAQLTRLLSRLAGELGQLPRQQTPPVEAAR
jgi:DNA-binding MarR family transcriptional regulator